MTNPRLPVLDRFIGELRAIWAANSDNQHRMAKAKPLLEKLVKDDDVEGAFDRWPSTEGRKNLLLYVDPDHHFVINAVVRMPGRTGSVHDHADAWVLYGLLDGSESLERFERIDDGSRPGYAEVSCPRSRPARKARSIWCRRRQSMPSKAARPARLRSSCAPRSSARERCCSAATTPKRKPWSSNTAQRKSPMKWSPDAGRR